ncbi:hypothetical protein ABW21_db0209759 [Orbilia brochopaga]|nr:hypothetical protein ABW21_db0209759 [Drechslerella brochopaga]
MRAVLAQPPGTEDTGIVDLDEIEQTEIIEGGEAELPIAFGPQYWDQNKAAIQQWAGWETYLARMQLQDQPTTGSLGEVNGYWGPESDLVVVTAEAWQAFEHALALDSTNIQGPPFYLLEGARRFKELSEATIRSARTIKKAIRRMKLSGDIDLWDKYEAVLTVVIMPMTNLALNKPEEYQRLQRMLEIPHGKTFSQYPNWLQTMISFATNHLGPLAAADRPGVMDAGSSLSPLNVPSEVPSIVPTKEMQRRSIEALFDYNRGEQGDADEVFLSDGDFILVWINLRSVVNALTYFQAFCVVDVDRIWDSYVFTYGTVRDRPLSLSPHVIGKYKRQQIGYRNYFELKYESRTKWMAPDDPEWYIWETTKNKAYLADMVEGYMQHLMNAAQYVLPLEMEMMADIAVQAHQLAEGSILPFGSEDLNNFAILTNDDFEDGLPLELSSLNWALLEQYPEFNLTRYVTETANSGPPA